MPISLRTQCLIADTRQLLRLPIRVAWMRTAREAVARTAAGVLRATRLPWRWWDGFLDGVPVAAGFTRDEVLRKLEEVARRRCGERDVLAV